jgi:hypothetical protein
MTEEGKNRMEAYVGAETKGNTPMWSQGKGKRNLRKRGEANGTRDTRVTIHMFQTSGATPPVLAASVTR